MKLLALVVAVSFGCVTGTTTPGVERCTTTFIIIGYHRECERGPTWDEIARTDPALFSELISHKSAARGTEAPTKSWPSPIPAPSAKSLAPMVPGWWCTRGAHGYGTCAQEQSECETYRTANVGFSACAHQDTASCHVMSGCFISDAACVRYEKEMGRGGLGCESRL